MDALPFQAMRRGTPIDSKASRVGAVLAITDPGRWRAISGYCRAVEGESLPDGSVAWVVLCRREAVAGGAFCEAHPSPRGVAAERLPRGAC